VTSLSSLLLDNVGELLNLSLGSEKCAELDISTVQRGSVGLALPDE
jgi:hypothetical protein